jgi:hypothetical protein
MSPCPGTALSARSTGPPTRPPAASSSSSAPLPATTRLNYPALGLPGAATAPGRRLPVSSGLSRPCRAPARRHRAPGHDHVNLAANKLLNSHDHEKSFRSCRALPPGPRPSPPEVPTATTRRRSQPHWLIRGEARRGITGEAAAMPGRTGRGGSLPRLPACAGGGVPLKLRPARPGQPDAHQAAARQPPRRQARHVQVQRPGQGRPRNPQGHHRHRRPRRSLDTRRRTLTNRPCR